MYERCKPFSLVHVTGFFNLYQSLAYLREHEVRGHAVECGCFLGGVAAFIGLCCERFALDLDIWLFDTFEGPPVGSSDTMVGGMPVETPAKLPNYEAQVRETLAGIVGDLSRYRFVVGLVEDTVPATRVGPIALLRLDTDFYPSTRIEMEHLYPRLIPGGVLIIDDYGTFAGSRRAVDEYLATLADPPLLNRIDIGIWAGVKPVAAPAGIAARIRALALDGAARWRPRGPRAIVGAP